LAYAYAVPEGVVRIASRAFYGAPLNLKAVMLPAEYAFMSLDPFTIHAPAGSAAARYAQESGIPCQAN
jgi:hypothetical protein